MEWALMLVLSIVSMIVSVVKDKKGKGSKDPVVGKRYWGDTLLAVATYSKNTARAWTNRIYISPEESIEYRPIPYATYMGDEHNIGSQGVNTLATTNFNVEFDTWVARGATWEGRDLFLRRANKVVRFTRGDGSSPQFPMHNQGMFVLAANQAFMGLNTAQLPSFIPIISVIPGTVYNLMNAHPQYGDRSLWVRFRDTTDLGVTISINPVAIIADLLLDTKKAEEIDWINFAITGVKLITQRPYMWFSIVVNGGTVSEAVRSVLGKAHLALRAMPDGRTGIKLIGDLPEGGVSSIAMMDALEELSEFTMVRSDLEGAATVINEMRGTYQAARADTTITIASIEESIIPPQYLDAYREWERANVAVLGGKTLAQKVALFPGMDDDEKNAYQAQMNAQRMGQNEWHYMDADAHAVNTANIVLTGVRRREAVNIDFLSWPDDAQAYLEDALIQSERTYMTGDIKGSMKLSDYDVGDLIRLVVRDPEAMAVIDRVFEITEVTIDAFPAEQLSLSLRENVEYYDILTPLQGQPGGTDPTKPSLSPTPDSVVNTDGSCTYPDGTTITPGGTVTVPSNSVTDPVTGVIKTPHGILVYPSGKIVDKYGNVILRPGDLNTDINVSTKPGLEPPPERPLEDMLFSIPMVAHVMSVAVMGVPAASACITWATSKLSGSEVYYVDNCNRETPKIPDNMFVRDAGTWPFNFELTESFELTGSRPGSMGAVEIYGKMMLPEMANLDKVHGIFTNNSKALGGTRALLFEPQFSLWSWAVISDATAEEPYGVASFFRFTFMETSVVADAGIYVRLRGIYCADIPRAKIFPAGSVLTVLATTSSNTGTLKITSIPIPAASAVPIENTNRDAFLKTSLTSSMTALPWARCHCDRYYIEQDWHETPPFDVYLHNTSNVFGAFGELHTVFVSSLSDQLDLWVNMMDFTNIESNKDLFGMAMPNKSSGFDTDHSVSDVEVLNSASGCKSSAKLFNAKVIIRRSGVNVATFNIGIERKMAIRFSLAGVGAAAQKGSFLEVFVEGWYNINTAMLNGSTITTKPITIKGPAIYYE